MKIDINCDVGEEMGNEATLLPYISSCNIACGGHAGTIEIMDEVISLAIKNKVKIGAHPSFPDRENFGRKNMNIGLETLKKSIEDQINILQKRALIQGQKLHHIKPHGALYNMAATNVAIAETIVQAVLHTCPDCYLYVPFNAVIAEKAVKNNIRIKYEAFADRNYNNDLTLVSRNNSDALITNKDKLLNHLSSMIFNKKVKTLQGDIIHIEAATYCVHGDTPNAIALVKFIYESLSKKGVTFD